MKKTGQNRRRRLSPEDSRERILHASLKLIGKKGWQGLSFQLIAKQCEMSPSNIVYHFASREILLLALLDHISLNNWEIVAKGMSPEMNAFERVVVHCQKNLEWARRFPQEAQVIFQIYADSSHDVEFSRVFRRMVDRAQERIREHLLAGQRENIFHFHEDSRVLAKYLHNMLVGALINTGGGRLTEPYEYPDDEWEKNVARLVGYNLKSA